MGSEVLSPPCLLGERHPLQVRSSPALLWRCCSVPGYTARDGGPGDTLSSLCTTVQGCQRRDMQEELLPSETAPTGSPAGWG